MVLTEMNISMIGPRRLIAGYISDSGSELSTVELTMATYIPWAHIWWLNETIEI
jgi:hypothetical protein